MKNLSALILVFAIAFAFFIIAPGLFGKPFSLSPYLKISDFLDLFTPLVLIPLYFLLFYFGTNQVPDLKSLLIFLVFAVLWVEGQAMHLAANSIAHWLSALEGDHIYKVTYFYDEIFSHYIWHFAVAALSVQLIYRSWKFRLPNASYKILVLIIAGIVYGFTIFIMSIEGGTVPLLFPFAVLVAIVLITFIWRSSNSPPILVFFMVGYAVAALFFIGWGIYWRSFPQFSHLGWI